MFDPHHTRYNDRRYYTRKGQIIQAKKVDPPFTIESHKIEAYKKYIVKNHLITQHTIPTVDSVSFSDDPNTYLISTMNTSTQPVTVVGPSQTIAISNSDDPNFYLVYLIWCPSSSATYQLPMGCRYKTFGGAGAVNDYFHLKGDGTTIMEFAQTHVSSTQTVSIPRIEINAIRKTCVQITDLPA